MESYRFVFQDNMYWGSCEPCTASVFSTLVRSSLVNWKIGMRQAVRLAVKTGKSLDPLLSTATFRDGVSNSRAVHVPVRNLHNSPPLPNCCNGWTC